MSPISPPQPDHSDDALGGQPRLIRPADPRGEVTSWMARGACHGVDPELFFPISVTGRAAHQVNAAKSVCDRCAVSRDCLSYALRVMPDGIWGGTTREERIAIRLRLVRPRIPAEG